MIRYILFLFVLPLVSVFYPFLAEAQECEKPPGQITEDIETHLKGSANVLARIVGKGEFEYISKKTQQDVYHQYPNADKVVLDLHLIYIFCTSIRDSTDLNTQEKLRALNDFIRVVRSPTSAPPRSFLEKLSGSYQLVSWNEAHGPITLYIDAKDGSLRIDDTGKAIWELYIQQRGERTHPSSRIKCKGQARTSSHQLDGVPGPGNEAFNWDRNIESVRESVWLTFCGWTTARPSDPFSISVDESTGGKKILQMKNSKGTFVWSK